MNQISGMLKQWWYLCLALAFLFSCQSKTQEMTFSKDVAFMQKHTSAFVLENQEGARLLLVPEYQGRVMSSTTGADNDYSFGWINYDLVSKGEFTPQISPFGGEDRFWLGPEGGQYSIFFAEGANFNLDDWSTPAAIDTVAYELTKKSATSATFTKEIEVTNYSGFTFRMQVDREVKLLDKEQISKLLEAKVPGSVSQVGFFSDNKITNRGEVAWQEENGLLSIWILGMFKPSPATTMIIPFKGEKSSINVNDEYFGRISKERLIVEDAIYFKADGQSRGKLGLPYAYAPEILGSYDAVNQVLTIVTFNKPDSATAYVNSLWKIQEEPYAGDVINAYNDGPPTPGADQLGPFYELETSSPAFSLQPKESGSHVHHTFHFQGDEKALDKLSRQLLGVGLIDNENLFK